MSERAQVDVLNKCFGIVLLVIVDGVDGSARQIGLCESRVDRLNVTFV